ncbi:MAG: hypothetical protein HYZ57_18100 [Acidobacteria bacterium]|nr:hypothetical protein [Acidobacteriota bacterium]
MLALLIVLLARELITLARGRRLEPLPWAVWRASAALLAVTGAVRILSLI